MVVVVVVMVVMDINIPMEVDILQIRREAEPHMMQMITMTKMMTIRVVVV